MRLILGCLKRQEEEEEEEEEEEPSFFVNFLKLPFGKTNITTRKRVKNEAIHI